MRRRLLLTLALVLWASTAAADPWVYRKADGLFCVQGADDPAKLHTQPANYALIEVAGAVPNPRTERADPSRPTGKRAATAAEISAFDAAQVQQEATTELQKRALLALARASWENIPAAARQYTWNQFKARWLALYQAPVE